MISVAGPDWVARGLDDTEKGSRRGERNAKRDHTKRAQREPTLEIRHTFHFLKRLRFPSRLQILEISRAVQFTAEISDSNWFYNKTGKISSPCWFRSPKRITESTRPARFCSAGETKSLQRAEYALTVKRESAHWLSSYPTLIYFVRQ